MTAGGKASAVFFLFFLNNPFLGEVLVVVVAVASALTLGLYFLPSTL